MSLQATVAESFSSVSMRSFIHSHAAHSPLIMLTRLPEILQPLYADNGTHMYLTPAHSQSHPG